MRPSFLFFMLALVLSSSHATQTHYQTPKAFMNLYYDFTGSTNPNYPKGKENASQELIESERNDHSQATLSSGPLILFMNSTLYIYDKNRQLRFSKTLRTAQNSGFFEMTALSHIGPGLAYLAYAKANGAAHWREGLLAIQKDIQAIQTINDQTEHHWLTELDATLWRPYRDDIRNMVTYALAMSNAFIEDVLQNKIAFTQENVVNQFFRGNAQFPIPYNNVMVGTFMLTAGMSMVDLHNDLTKINIDWPNAKVLIRFVAGTNVTAGLSTNNNWLVPMVKALSGNALNDDHIYIAAYLAVKKSLGEKQLPQADFDYYANTFDRIYNRTHVAKKIFSYIPDISPSERPPLPGDYAVTPADNIDDFMLRLKFSMSHPTEMLSNTVAYWIAGELAAKNWDLNHLAIPGVNRGFPKGIKAYPKG